MDVGLTGGDETAIGAQVGKYRVVRRLGEGAFGAVYEALLPGPMGFTKRVAIKKIRSSLVRQDPRFVQSMINEARIGGLLHHANIVDVLEFDQVGERYFIAMEFVDGPTLAQALEACKTHKVLLPRFAMVDIAMQICRGLHYAHTFRDPGSIYPVEVLAEGLRGGPAIIAGATNNALGGRGAVMALGLVGADGEAPPFYGNPAGRNIGLYWYRVAGKDHRDFLALDTAGGDITVRLQGASELRLDRYGQPRDAADGAGGEATAAQRWEAEQESLERFRAAIDRLQRDPEAWQREFDELWALVEEHGWEGYEEALVVLESDFLVRHHDRIQAVGRLTTQVGDSGDFPRAQQQVMRLMFDPTNPVDALDYWRRHAQQDANEWPRTVEARYLLLARRDADADALIGTITDADVTRAASESDACWWRGDMDCLLRLAESNRSRFGNSPGFLRPFLRAAVWTDEDHGGYLPYTAGAIDAYSPPLGYGERLAYLEWTLIRARLQLRGGADGAVDALATLDGVAGELDEFVAAYREHQDLRAMVAITRAEAAATLGQGPRACDELRAMLAAPAAIPPWLVERGRAASGDLGCSP